MKSKRILYAESHADSGRLLTALLKLEGFTVVVAPTVDLAVECAGKEKFDLFLLAGRFPDGDGVEICRRIRLTDTVTPVICYFAADLPRIQAECFAAGAQEFLSKPKEFPVILNRIAYWLARRAKGENIFC
ncbi:MAG: PAS domain S-box [Parcubacteria group bacterium GW2011_GWA1_59_11]|nr:MAG: PAS domain S-box [Parcubacteria group bacterium GW2011_GWA1_59_11]